MNRIWKGSVLHNGVWHYKNNTSESICDNRI